MSTTSPPPAPPLAVARILNFGLIAGVVIFGAVAWYLTGGGAQPLGSDASLGQALTYAWIAVAFGSGMAAMMVWRTMVAPRTTSSATMSPEEQAGRLGALQNGLIVTWALLEGQGLLGVVVFLLTGAALPFWGAFVVLAVGYAMTRPRAEWYRER